VRHSPGTGTKTPPLKERNPVPVAKEGGGGKETLRAERVLLSGGQGRRPRYFRKTATPVKTALDTSAQRRKPGKNPK